MVLIDVMCFGGVNLSLNVLNRGAAKPPNGFSAVGQSEHSTPTGGAVQCCADGPCADVPVLQSFRFALRS